MNKGCFLARWAFMNGLALVMAVASGSSPLKPQASPPYNVLLVTPDQLRADFMHTYGYASSDTPHIDQLGQQGTVFVRAYSSGPWTTPSFTSILTGLFPTVHGMTLPPYQGCGTSITHPMVNGGIPPVPDFVNLSRQKPVLAEILKAHGMITAADNANCWSFFDNVNRGWDSFKFFPGYQMRVPEHPDSNDPFYLTAPQTLAWAAQWLTAHRRDRFFFWVHFMEPHSPYNPPRTYDRFKTPDDFPDLYDDNHQGGLRLNVLAKMGDAHAIRRLEELYAAKILYVDEYVGELMKTVHDLGLDEDTLVILVSDHGQLVYSHPEDFNTDDHRSVYDADLHIPLIIRGPKIPAGKRVDALVSQYDLAPTILGLENLPRLPHADGASLVGILQGSQSLPHKYLFGEESSLEPQYSARDERYKVIESLRSGKIQCFDNLVDPAEKRDLCAESPLKAGELKAVLDQHIQTMIKEAKSYSDWQDNLALAVIEQRDSKGLLTLAPRRLNVAAPGGAGFQLGPKGWFLSSDSTPCARVSYWGPPGPGNATVVWRFDTPMIGEYEISICYAGSGQPGQRLATNANFLVRFRGGTLSFPIDENHKQGQWNVLGQFSNPISVELTNRADGPVVTASMRFVRLSEN